jgi:predicted DNA binding protein
LEGISKIGGIIWEASDRHKVYLFTTPCSCIVENSIVKNIDAFNLLHISPVVFEHGWEYYRVIVFRHENVKGLLQRLEEKGFVFEVLRKVPFDGFVASSLTLTVDALFSDLTEKQMDAFLTAYSNGYYKLPRKADVTTIASKGECREQHFKNV